MEITHTLHRNFIFYPYIIIFLYSAHKNLLFLLFISGFSTMTIVRQIIQRSNQVNFLTKVPRINQIRTYIMSGCIGIAGGAGLLRQFAWCQRFLVKPTP